MTAAALIRARAAAAIALSVLLLSAGCGGSSGSGGGGGGGSGHHSARSYPALSVPANPPARSVRVPILTYHRVHNYATEITKSVPDLTVEPEVFAAEMDALARAGYTTISQRQLFNALFNGGSLPPKPVLISVDDGYVDDVSEILPVLEREHMVATFYVVTSRFGEQGFLSAGQVRELDAAGMDVGAHTRHHVPLPELDAAALESEVAGSRSDLEHVLGHSVYFFAYPFGDFNARVVAAVRSAGFLLATTTQPGAVESSLAPLNMPRIHVGRLATPATVLSLVGGGRSPSASGE